MAETLDNIPPPRVPVIDERTGLISREWYRFFLDIFRRVGQDDTRVIEDFTVAPQDSLSLLASIVDQVQAVELAPARTMPVPPVYGSFAATTDQTAALANTAYAVKFDSTLFAFGAETVSATEISVTSPGAYNFQFLARLTKASGGTANAWLWPRVNGVDIPDSATIFQITGNGAQQPFSWNFLLPLAAEDTFELVWAVSSTDVLLDAQAAAAPVPGVSAAALTVIKVT